MSIAVPPTSVCLLLQWSAISNPFTLLTPPRFREIQSNYIEEKHLWTQHSSPALKERIGEPCTKRPFSKREELMLHAEFQKRRQRFWPEAERLFTVARHLRKRKLLKMHFIYCALTEPLQRQGMASIWQHSPEAEVSICGKDRTTSPQSEKAGRCVRS